MDKRKSLSYSDPEGTLGTVENVQRARSNKKVEFKSYLNDKCKNVFQ